VTPDEQTALVVLVPEAEPLVADVRRRFDRSAVRGMPAHVTVLYPFRHPDDVSPELLHRLARGFSPMPGFAFRLVGVCGFPGVVYLAPEPAAPFDELTRTVVGWFPEHRPYGGLVPDPKPHLTLAQKPPATSLTAVTHELLGTAGSRLPLQCAARSVALALKRAGRWSVGPSFALA